MFSDDDITGIMREQIDTLITEYGEFPGKEHQMQTLPDEALIAAWRDAETRQYIGSADDLVFWLRETAIDQVAAAVTPTDQTVTFTYVVTSLMEPGVVVSSGSGTVTVPAGSDATTAAETWVADHDSRVDPRIDPRITITDLTHINVEESSS